MFPLHTLFTPEIIILFCFRGPEMPALPRVEHTQLFINNAFVDSVSGRTFETINPADETVIAKIAEAGRSGHK